MIYATTKHNALELPEPMTLDLQAIRDKGAFSPTGFSSRLSGSNGAQSPMGSQRSKQLRLDLINEGENIGRMLGETGNFWSAEVVQNEANYDRQDVMGLEDEKLELIHQCA